MSNGGTFVGALLLLATVSSATGCVAETRVVEGGPGDAAAAASHGGWTSTRGGAEPAPEDVGPPDRITPEVDPADLVTVPRDVAQGVLDFFDGEGFLLADIIEIDCSYQPFMAQMVAQATASFAAGVQVERTDERSDDILTVTLTRRIAGDGGAYNTAITPRATFPSLRALDRDDVSRTVEFRPPFEFTAVRRLVIRVHLQPSADRPVFFRAVGRSAGVPDPATGEAARESLYMNPNSRKKVRADTLTLSAEIRNDGGRWSGAVREP